MIRLRKSLAPEVLKKNAEAWTKEYLEHVSGKTKVPEALARKYRHRDIKAAVKKETHGKCAYCESKVSHTYPGDVEHVLPKDKRPEFVFEWSNLAYSCSTCNNGKRAYYSKEQPLVNPYVDDPDEHLFFAGPMCCHRRGNAKGEVTVTKLKLNRLPLIERRKERIEQLTHLAERVKELEGTPLGSALDEELKTELQDDREYAAAARAFVAALLAS